MSPDVNTYRFSDVELGETLSLQIISLTNHPVGKYSALQNHPDYTMDQPQREFITNGQNMQTSSKKSVSNVHPDYPGCLPGTALSVTFTGMILESAVFAHRMICQ